MADACLNAKDKLVDGIIIEEVTHRCIVMWSFELFSRDLHQTCFILLSVLGRNRDVHISSILTSYITYAGTLNTEALLKVNCLLSQLSKAPCSNKT